MCGIAGYIGIKALSEVNIKGCLNLMRRRGPDAKGHYKTISPSGKHVHLLHSRLSILDLDERANQPFQDEDFAMVFNGEIYNYNDLKRDPVLEGWRSKGTGDTEVLFGLLTKHWTDSFSYLDGMWSLAIYDKNSGDLLLSRDRFGEKPLYYYTDSYGNVFFGSEPKFIFALLGQNLTINTDQICRYLVNGYKSLYKDSSTFFRGLKTIPAGTQVIYKNDGERLEKKYWSPNLENDEYLDLSFDSSVLLVKETLLKSVEQKLHADVPIAFCLSGGIDSNALAALARKELGREVTGFSVVNSDPRYDEYDFIQAGVRDMEIDHHELSIKTTNFIEDLKEVIAYHDTPVYTITYFAHWQLMSIIRKNGFKVSISGTGADELFSGYYDHHNFFHFDMKNTDAGLFEDGLMNWKTHVSSIVRNPFLKDPLCFIKSPMLRDHIYLNADYFAEYLHHKFERLFQEQKYCQSMLRNRMANELFHEIVPPILHMDDMNAMYHSIENRSPYLDRQLFELAYKIPTKHLIKNGRAKALLREAVRGVCCDKIIDNPKKVGFNAPIENYFDLESDLNRDFLLQDSPIFHLVRREKIEQYLTKKEFSNSESKFLFSFISAKIFMETYAT